MTRRDRGFTLIEVVIALAILGVSLTVLLQAQASSLSNAGRSRDLTIATILARSKMVDVEKHLFHDGFQQSSEEEDGDFTEEGHPDVKWKWKISEVELDLTALTSLCGTMAKKTGAKGDDTGVSDCESMLGGIGAMAGGFLDEIGRSLRVVDLQLSWTDGRAKPTMNVRALLSQDDFSTAQQSEVQKVQDTLQSGQPQGAAPPPAVK